MNKTQINDFQSIIEEEDGNYVFRFTDTFKNGIHDVKLNEIAEITGGISKFIWSDETTLSISKQFSSEFSNEDLDEFISELKRGFRLD